MPPHGKDLLLLAGGSGRWEMLFGGGARWPAPAIAVHEAGVRFVV